MMTRTLVVVALAATSLAATAVEAPPDPHRAGVVIDTGEETKTVCVRFSEDAITGEELLRRADVDAVLASFGGLGTAVCSLCGVGCPADDCFCAGAYWSLWGRVDGGWETSPRGAAEREVTDGDLHGWVWGDGRTPPPDATFTTVCAEEAIDRPPPQQHDPTPTAGELRGIVWFVLTMLAILGAVLWVRRDRDERG